MNDFDPYYQWLGIPPTEQPAHHYRLLGVSEFEPDSEVIENAADQRTLLVRNMASGPHAKLSQRLLNEIAAARLVLIDRKKKVEYDQTLRERNSQAATSSNKGEMAVAAPTARPGNRPPPRGKKPKDSDSTAAVPLGIAVDDERVSKRGKHRTHQRSQLPWVLLAVGGVVALAGVGLYFALNTDGSPDEIADKQPEATVELNSISEKTAEVGQPLKVNVKTKIDGDVEDELVYSLEEGTPFSATIDKSTGEILWTPSDDDSGRQHSFRVRIKAGKLSDTTWFVVTVPEANQPPRFGAIRDRSVKVGDQVVVQLQARDENRSKITYRLASPLPGARVNSRSGEFRYRASTKHAGQKFTVKVGAKDAEGAEAFQQFDIQIASLNSAPKPTPHPKPTPTQPPTGSKSLITRIDPARDAVAGRWSQFGNMLVTDRAAASRLELAAPPQTDQYMLASKVTSDRRTAVAGLPVAGRQVLVVLGDSEKSTGLKTKNGSLIGALATNSGSALAKNRATDVRYFVHKDGLLVTCDGKPVIDWRGNWSDLGEMDPRWQVRSKDKVFLGADQSKCVWEEPRFEEVNQQQLASTLAKLAAQRAAESASKMPSDEALAAARELANKAFGARLKSDRTLEKLTETYEKIMAARRDKNASPAVRYVLSEMAIDVATRAGKTKVVIGLIDQLAEEFEVPTEPLYLDALESLGQSRHATSSASQQELAEVSTSLLAKLMTEERFASAYKISNVALQAARKSRQADITRLVSSLKKDITTLGRMHRDVVEARKKPADDASANFVLGRWEAFVNGNWSEGLKRIASGNNAMLADLAKRDMAAPKDAKTQAALAQEWYELGKKTEGRMQREINKRAAYWYASAAPKLTTLEKEVISSDFKKAVAEAAKDEPKIAINLSDVGELTDIAGNLTKSEAFLVGVVASLREGYGKPCIASIQPIYQRHDNGKRSMGQTLGQRFARPTSIAAKHGYAVGAINMRRGLLVNGFELVFMKKIGSRLDPTDSYKSPWFGDQSGGSSRTSESGGRLIAALQGRANSTHVTDVSVVAAEYLAPREIQEKRAATGRLIDLFEMIPRAKRKPTGRFESKRVFAADDGILEFPLRLKEMEDYEVDISFKASSTFTAIELSVPISKQGVSVMLHNGYRSGMAKVNGVSQSLGKSRIDRTKIQTAQVRVTKLPNDEIRISAIVDGATAHVWTGKISSLSYSNELTPSHARHIALRFSRDFELYTANVWMHR